METMAKPMHALIIDDEPDICELLQITLQRMDISSSTANTIREAKSLLKTESFNLCITDVRLPDGDGIDLVEHIQSLDYHLPVTVITAHGNMDVAVRAMKAGAFDFLTKPIDLTNLRNLVSNAAASSELNVLNNEEINIIGKSSSIANLKKTILKLARSQAPVYISGESGSGKELVARAIHQHGPRKDKPFIPVNCGAIPAELMESEFFGHKKGAFTGAAQEKKGLFLAADQGTLFLDEVADLPLDMQVKLLRAIQEKSIRPVGAENELKTNIRILCATHKNLENLVSQGLFRQDLYYRLNVIKLMVPPLRERSGDLPLLIDNILLKLSSELDQPAPKLSPEARQALTQYTYPGNIRELENILERAFTLSDGQRIEKDDLDLNIYPSLKIESESGKLNHYQNTKSYESIDEYLAEIEKDILCEALDQAHGNRTLAAQDLGISFRSMRYRLKKLGLSDTD